MTILTDEIVEKAAEALCKSMATSPVEWRDVTERGRKLYRRDARAALQAVLPDVVETAAKMAEGHDPNALVYRWVLARDIRSLLNKEDK